MPLALTGYEIGLLAVACVFIAFALIVALVVPRARPDFPARRLGLFVAVCIALFAAQMTAVLVLAEVGEADEAHGEAAPTETTETTPGETTTETTETETTEGGGDAAAGKEVFATAGCVSCHTLADAGTSGTVGPNLDEVQPSAEAAYEQIRSGGGGMPPYEGQLSEQELADVTAYVVQASSG